jgi:alpha-tubulin suppressor-like RCC1 family protein
MLPRMRPRTTTSCDVSHVGLRCDGSQLAALIACMFVANTGCVDPSHRLDGVALCDAAGTCQQKAADTDDSGPGDPGAALDSSTDAGDAGPDRGPDAGNAGRPCIDDTQCDDGKYCNGVEHCSAGTDEDGGSSVEGVCETAISPPCSAALCDEEAKRCDCDADRDGISAWFCNGQDNDADGDGFSRMSDDARKRDCDDMDPEAFPGHPELCDYQGHDEDCDLTTVAGKTNEEDRLRDKDNDTYIDIRCINKDATSGEIHVWTDPDHGNDVAQRRQPDCNDELRSVHPGPDTDDHCDGIDDDCDGWVDEKPDSHIDRSLQTAYCLDADGDNWSMNQAVTYACGAPVGYMPCRFDLDPDCNEDAKVGRNAYPGHAEVCDGIDNDCDDAIDERTGPGKLLWDEPSFSDGTTAECKKGGQWDLSCPADKLWCDTTTIAHGCETDVTRLSRCRSCYATSCSFACGQHGCDEIVQMAAGRDFACAVTNEGRAACWGRGAEGRLGNDEQRSSSIPTAVVAITDVTNITAGGAHACAVVGTDSAAYCWGSNQFGQLANSDASDLSTVPLPVAGAQGGTTLRLLGVRRISAGDQHTCALVDDGKVVCWGQTQGGRLGNGNNETRPAGTQSLPQFVYRLIDYPPIGQLRNDVQDAADVVAGEAHTCMLTKLGTVECWGSNANGQLAADSAAVPDASIPKVVPGLMAVEQISAGARHTCALISKRVSCWGDNKYQQLGRPSVGSDYIPTEISTLPDVVEVSAGNNATCARTATGLVYCWGGNNGGLLGFLDPPTSETQTEPRIVMLPLANVTRLVVNQFACAHTGDAHIFCWGHNVYGQLGRGTTALEPEPLPAEIRPLVDSVY